jgi:predicted transcriptional regulator
MMIRPLDTLIAIKAINLMPDLRESDRRVAVTLIEHFNRKTGRCDPGLKRMADLLGYSERTIIRSTERLERAGLIRKVRHGHYSNRNHYEPNWARFAELNAAWDEKMRAKSRRREVSPSAGQQSHVEGDSRVTQTCRINRPESTCSRGHPKEALGESTTRGRAREAAQSGQRSADAARTEAERRWSDALLKYFEGKPLSYAEAVEAIDVEMAASATDAEVRQRGAGFVYLLSELRISP